MSNFSTIVLPEALIGWDQILPLVCSGAQMVLQAAQERRFVREFVIPEQQAKRNGPAPSILSVSLWVPKFPRSLASDQRSKIKIDNVLWDFKRACHACLYKTQIEQNARCLNPGVKAEAGHSQLRTI